MTLTMERTAGPFSEVALREAGFAPAMTPTEKHEPRLRGEGIPDGRWGLVLAGGDGTRLQSLTRFVCGDDRPKQFCPIFEGRTLLGQTLERTRLNLPAERTLVSLVENHSPFYSREEALLPSQRVVQPANKGTAPAIVHGLMSIARRDEKAIVAVLPSDHYYSDEFSFAFALESAFEAAAERPSSVILLGVPANKPEVEYGWIELGCPLASRRTEVYSVRGFWEKPDLCTALTLFHQGAFWNSFVMVGRAHAFLEIVRRSAPAVLEGVGRLQPWDGAEIHLDPALHRRIPSSCFSRDVLSPEASRLLALPLTGTEWSDLGDPRRVASLIQATGLEPGWFKNWVRSIGPSSVTMAPNAAAIA